MINNNTMTLLQLIVTAVAITTSVSFSPTSKIGPARHVACRPTLAASSSQLHLITESDVIKSVEIAEKLWDQALAARKHANELSVRAETLGEEAATTANDVTTALKEGKSISVEKIEQAGRAQDLSLELGSLLDEAVEAQKKADEIEALAEEALKESEAAFAQFLVDNPEEA